MKQNTDPAQSQPPEQTDESQRLLRWAIHEIQSLRRINNELSAKAEAYDLLVHIILPKREQWASEDVVFAIEKFLGPAASQKGGE